MNGYEFDLGFLGGGQLARMSIQAAQRMGLDCISLDPDENSPAAQIASSVTGALNDAESVAGKIIRRSAKITLENEFIPARVIRQAFAMTGRNLDALLPGINSLELIQDKYHQRKAFKEAALKGPKFALVEDDGALAVASIGFPMILKARFGGYDGKGTQLAESPLEFEELSMIWRDGDGTPKSSCTLKERSPSWSIEPRPLSMHFPPWKPAKPITFATWSILRQTLMLAI